MIITQQVLYDNSCPLLMILLEASLFTAPLYVLQLV